MEPPQHIETGRLQMDTQVMLKVTVPGSRTIVTLLCVSPTLNTSSFCEVVMENPITSALFIETISILSVIYVSYVDSINRDTLESIV